MNLFQRLARELEKSRNADGGWGVAPSMPSNTECTALSCLALESHNAAMAAQGRTWLRGSQQNDGSWSYIPGGPQAGWPTAVVLLALRGETSASREIASGYSWLTETTGTQLSWRLRLREFFTRNQVVELDSTLNGWPWVAGTFAWVEPTSWAMMALKNTPKTKQIEHRIDEGTRMLIDRACVGGGWNYGNKRVLDELLSPYPDTTAIALMALHGADTRVVAEGFSALDRLLDQHASGLSLSLALLARRVWDRPGADLEVRLTERLDEGIADRRTLAIAALAASPDIGWINGGGDA